MSDPAEPLVLYDVRDRVATITFNRPSRLNAFNDDMTREALAAMRRFDLDPEADVAVLTGAGRAFSSGADVQQRQLRPREEMEKHGGPQARDANSENLLTDCVNWKPVICAAHGYVLGLALGIALECDLIVAEEGTKFQVTEAPNGSSLVFTTTVLFHNAMSELAGATPPVQDAPWLSAVALSAFGMMAA